jgi:hypothetical protein
MPAKWLRSHGAADASSIAKTQGKMNLGLRLPFGEFRE